MIANRQHKISIAIATYNGDKYLQEQLDSFLAQTRRPDELVITDDCSTDNTMEIIQAFAAKAPFEVRWDQNEKNLGYTGNFNQALMKTTGDLVFLSDQDDVWFPEKLARMERHALDDLNALVVMNDAALTDCELNDTGLTKLGQIASAGMTHSSFVMGCCAAVRRELLDLCLPIPAGLVAHDSWIIGIANGLGRKKILPEVLQYYRRHSSNESQIILNRTRRVTRLDIYLEAMREHWRDFGKKEASQTGSPQANEGKLMLDWSRAAITDAPISLKINLQAFTILLEKKIAKEEERELIRRFRGFQRLQSVFKYWLNGGYKSFSGIKSAIRDLLFR